MDLGRIDLVLQYALAVAAEEDERGDRELGPIHLIKYVYLGDLAHAHEHGGETFTGAPWRFYHFGPWSAEVFERIEPATMAIRAERRTIESRFDKDAVRYCLADIDSEADALGARLPREVASRVKLAVHRFTNDTSGLLDYVYRTQPMLDAAPSEYLRFDAPVLAIREPVGTPDPPLSAKQQKKRREKMNAVREKLLARLAAPSSRRLVPPDPAPRYDDLYYEAQADLADVDRVDSTEGELRISEGVWKSPARGDPHVP